MIDNLPPKPYRAGILPGPGVRMALAPRFALGLDPVSGADAGHPFPRLLPFLIRPRSAPGRQFRSAAHLRGLLQRSYGRGLAQVAVTLTFLAYQAWLMSDAIIRTLVRLFITKKNMLEWTTAAQAKHAVDFELSNMYRRKKGGILLAAAAAPAIALYWRWASGTRGSSASPACLFSDSPGPRLPRSRRAGSASLPKQRHDAAPLSRSETEVLRLTSRRTWRFFDEFVTAEDHWLPPDNFQENPKPWSVCAPHLANQYRPVPAFGPRRQRSGVDGRYRNGRALGTHFWGPQPDGALPRPFLQLV